tara:strand:+ start:348 stop:527 length:180 start_codon:yes stop_codon:yes gene_type:complete
VTNNEMEKIYETLAIKIDEFGKDKSNIFFAKLVLLLANELNNFEKMAAYIEEATLDLDH